MANVQVACSKCGKPYKVDESKLGKAARCASCGEKFVLSVAKPAPVPTAPPVPASDPPSSLAQTASQPVVRAAPPDPVAAAPQQYVAPQAMNQTNVAIQIGGGRSTSGLGVAALVLGIIAALICWIPFIGLLGTPLAILGLVFGIIGLLIALIGRKAGLGMPISGSIVCVVALIIAIASTGAATVAVTEALDEIDNDMRGSASGSLASAGGDSGDVPMGADKQAYLSKVLLKDVKVAKAVLGGRGVFGEIKNTGDRTLKEVEIIVYCLNDQGKAIFEETYHPVLVTSGFTMGDNKPLKPNYSEKFGYGLDDAPSEWKGKVRVEITNIEFAD